jgi:hypothetical protein
LIEVVGEHIDPQIFAAKKLPCKSQGVCGFKVTTHSLRIWQCGFSSINPQITNTLKNPGPNKLGFLLFGAGACIYVSMIASNIHMSV